jgi:hypothetical protein
VFQNIKTATLLNKKIKYPVTIHEDKLSLLTFQRKPQPGQVNPYEPTAKGNDASTSSRPYLDTCRESQTAKRSTGFFVSSRSKTSSLIAALNK